MQDENQPQVEESQEERYARLYGQQAQPVPQPAAIPPEVIQTITSLRSEVAALNERIAAKPQEIGPAAWVEKIRQGDFEGAENVLAQKVQQALQPRLEEVRNRAYQDALSASQVNLEIDRHVQKARLENPDIVHFEKYLEAPVSQRVAQANALGLIKSPADFVRETKSAIDAEVTQLRNLGLVLRGQGKQEAQTRNQQVLASTPLTPNQVQSTQVTDASQLTPDESLQSYFERRRADEQRRHGM